MGAISRIASIIRRRRRGGASPDMPLFALDFEPSIANLPRQVNGEDPVLWYTADGSGGMTAEYGPALSEVGAGSSPYDMGDSHPMFGAGDNATRFVEGTVLQEATPGTHIGSANHVLISLLIYLGEKSGDAIITARDPANPNSWWAIYNGSAVDTLALYLDGATGSGTCTSGALTRGAWNLVEWRMDRTQSTAADSCQAFVNGAASGSPLNVSAIAGALDGVNELTIGGYSTGASPCDAGFAMFSVHASNDLGFAGATNDADWLAAHQENFARLTGTYANAKGTATPTTMTRASAKHIIKDDSSGNRIFVQVGAGWTDVCRVWDGTQLRTGFRGENAATNLLADSEDLTAWTNTASSDATAGASVLGRTKSTITGDGTTDSHNVYDTFTAANATQYVGWAIVEAGTEAYAILSLDVNGGTDVDVSLNLSTGVAASVTGTPDAYGVVGLGNGVYAVYLADTETAGATRNFKVGVSSDGAVSSDASGTMHIHHAQVEAGAYPSSPIYTSGGTASRVADVLAYSATNNYDASGIRVEHGLISTMDTSADSPLGLLYNIGNAAFTAIVRGRITTGGVAECQVYSGGGKVADVTGTTGVDDGTYRTVQNIAKTDDCRLLVDGVSEGTPDTSMAMPGAMTHIYLKTDFVASVPSVDHLCVAAFKIYKA